MNITACLLAVAFFIYAPTSAIPAPREDIRALASDVGRVLGAASACPAIARARVKGISDKITNAIKSSLPSEDESRAVLGLFSASYLDGSRDVNTMKTDCARADRELADLESACLSKRSKTCGTSTWVSEHRLPSARARSHKVWGTQLNEAGNYEPVELQ